MLSLFTNEAVTDLCAWFVTVAEIKWYWPSSCTIALSPDLIIVPPSRSNRPTWSLLSLWPYISSRLLSSILVGDDVPLPISSICNPSKSFDDWSEIIVLPSSNAVDRIKSLSIAGDVDGALVTQPPWRSSGSSYILPMNMKSTNDTRSEISTLQSPLISRLFITHGVIPSRNM